VSEAAARQPIRALVVHSSPGERAAQEDHALAVRERGIFAVADGFGGPGPGLAAAKAACEGVRGFLEKEAGDLEATLPFVLKSYYSLAGNVLFNALVHANRKVLALNKGRGVHERGGASLVAAFLDRNLLALANVGACSATLLRDGASIDLVAPRTYGRLRDPFATDSRPEERVPLTAVGLTEDLEPEIVECQVRAGDWLLLYTDGLESGIRDELLRQSRAGRAPTTAAESAAALLKSVRSGDNLTISLIIF
jgi:serine/threonine protein phosphatase PrpC